MRTNLWFLLLAPGVALTAQAGCNGDASFFTCADPTGMAYNVSKFGNFANATGYNANSGVFWSQSSQKLGNTSYASGIATNGNSWRSETTDYGNGFSTTRGTDARGYSFTVNCGPFGCY